VDAQFGKSISGAAGTFGKMGKGEVFLRPILSYPEHSELIGVAGPFAHHINGEIEVCGNIKMEASSLSLIVGHVWGLGHCHMKNSFQGRTQKIYNGVVWLPLYLYHTMKVRAVQP